MATRFSRLFNAVFNLCKLRRISILRQFLNKDPFNNDKEKHFTGYSNRIFYVGTRLQRRKGKEGRTT